MSEMLEKVARAWILAGLERTFVRGGPRPDADELEAYLVEQAALHLPLARAAVEALREPSEGMKELARNAWDAYGEDGKIALFQAFLDHILKEG